MVRSAELKDINAINKLGKLIFENFEQLFKMEEILNESFSKVFVYESDGKVVGFIHIIELYETIDIINIAVDKDYRNQNIATVLIDYMISDASHMVNIITLEVDTSNKAALKLYEKFGFEIVSTRKSYYKEKDAYLMVKRVKG